MAGGVHHGGEEFNARSTANAGIIAFFEYWLSLPLIQQELYYREYKGLQEMIGRLMRSGEADCKAVRYGVELITEALNPIVQAIVRARENNQPAFSHESIQAFQNIILEKKKSLKKPYPLLLPMLCCLLDRKYQVFYLCFLSFWLMVIFIVILCGAMPCS